MKYSTLLLLFGISLPTLASEQLKLPHYDWGACPFECCTYKEWETTRQVTAHEKPSNTSKVLFTVREKQAVTGLTGVVITTRPGVTRILKHVQLGYTKDEKGPMLFLMPGERIYTLHYLGEGYDLFWYKGNIYSDQCDVSENAFGDMPFASDVKVESRPQTSWWVKFKDSKGRVGWSKVNRNFDHMDACE
jgi:hypothetical protein